MSEVNIDVLADQVETLRQQIKGALQDIVDIKMSDNTQTLKLSQIENKLEKADEKLDTLVEFLTEAKGARKWVLGLLALVVTVVGLLATLSKWQG